MKISPHKNDHDSQALASIRLRFIFGVLLVLVVCTIGRVFYMQSFRHLVYKDRAADQHERERTLHARRGTIYFVQGDADYPAAVNREFFLAYLSEPEVLEEEKDDVARRVAEIFDVEFEYVRAKLGRIGDPYEVVARKIPAAQKDVINDMGISGLHFDVQQLRYYPGEELATQLLGFVGADENSYTGRYGAERYFEDELLGSAGSVHGIFDARGGWNTISDRSESPRADGASIYLTIDRTVQQEVEKILAEDTVTYGAERSAAIVMEAQTGKIIAMAQMPTHSLNAYGQADDLAVFRNLSVSDPYESGSVFKTFTLAMGLDAGLITPETTYVDEGFVQADEFKIRNAENKVYGLQTMTKVLEDSINTGVIHVQKILGNEKFKEYTEQFGFGVPTGIELPSESAGDLRNISNLRKYVEFYTASYGQGITVTPLQLLQAYGALANDGMMMRPSVLEKITYPDGREETHKPQEIRRMVSQKTSEQIGEMLYQVVAGGHARLASVPGYRVGGKTGTAQVARIDAAGYDEDRKNTTFVGYAPISDLATDSHGAPESRYVVLVKYENPVNVEWAATSASPTFGRIMKFLLEYKRIAPTEEITVKKSEQPINVAD